MKIDPNTMIGIVTGRGVVPGAAAPSGTSFEQVLEGVRQAGAPQGAHPLSSIPGAGDVSPQKFTALSVTGQALEMLQSYARALEDSALGLRDLAPMVDEMDALCTAVKEAGSFLSDSDPLKGIMDDVQATMKGELMRFRRGDLVG
jgi:hypothetical protein